ncbi:hypothetical protein Fmac_008371 [Flemingia macrophylla]|uniref:Uncharacterized protein n=1 Tax=Flemingia macrophylla TaxID=520843 RepID=A0ABD1MX86_9FABA
MASNSQQFSDGKDVIFVRGVHDVSTDSSAEARKLEGKIHSLVNLVTQLAVNQKSASVARLIESVFMQTTTTIKVRHLIEKMASNSQPFSTRNDANVIRGLHDVATNTSAKTRKLEGKLDVLVNLVTQQVVNQNSASVTRVFGIRSSNDHHTNVCPSLRQSGVNEHLEAYAANIYSKLP